MKYWETIADRIHKQGWSYGYVQIETPEGLVLWNVDAHRSDGRRYIARSDELLTAFLELEAMLPNDDARKDGGSEVIGKAPLQAALAEKFYKVQAARQDCLEKEIQSKMAALLVQRARIVSFLNEQCDLIVTNIRGKLTPLVQNVEAKEKVVKVEAQKLGLAI